jgi:hypothetical protein
MVRSIGQLRDVHDRRTDGPRPENDVAEAGVMFELPGAGRLP